MPTCKLCERHFEQHEIEEGVEVQHAGSGRLKLVRFLNGDLHQFKNEKKKSVMPKGSVVSPPKPVEAPPTEVAETPAVQETTSLEELAEILTEHFETSTVEPYNADLEVEPTAARDTRRHDPRNAVEEIGETLEGIVVGYTPYPNDRGAGFIRLLKYDRARSGLFFTTDNIVVGNFIGLGVRVKCLVCKPEPGKRSLVAKQIEVLELEPTAIDASSKTQVYNHEEN